MEQTFSKLTMRRGTNSYKWDEPKRADIIPMWVADMDFEVAPQITAALQERINHPIYGYTMVPESYYQSITNWYARRHNWQIERSWIIYTSGVVPAVSACIKAMTMPSEQVLLMTPAYNCFFSCIRNNGCEVVESPLLYKEVEGGNSVGRWMMDYDDIERKCQSERLHTLLLCSPHNPVGRVWSRDELQRLNDICMRHGVRIIADEIHNEIIMPGHKFVAFGSISDETLHNSVTCCSPTKGFNFAGLQIANIICQDNVLRQHIDRAINIMECCDVNPFGVIALQTAYNDCEAWLDEMCLYVYQNYTTLVNTLRSNRIPWHVSKLEGTYLAWIDISDSGFSSDEMVEKLICDAGVMVSSGTLYGNDGEGFVRMNLACPQQRLQQALDAIVAAFA